MIIIQNSPLAYQLSLWPNPSEILQESPLPGPLIKIISIKLSNALNNDFPLESPCNSYSVPGHVSPFITEIKYHFLNKQHIFNPNDTNKLIIQRCYYEGIEIDICSIV